MKKKWILIVAGVPLVVFLALAAYIYFYVYLPDPGRLTTAPEFSGLTRTVSDNTLSSPNDPAVLMTFAEQYKYLGGQKFVLYGTADVEQHFFVEEHSDGSMKSFFWIQFEGFLPDNDFTYDYSASPLREQIGDFDFFVDTAAGKSSPIFRLGWPGTDGYLARKFLADKGYLIPDNFAYARLAHIPDEGKRKELLIFFDDDLEPMGYTGDSLRQGGEHADLWPEVEAAHLEKIKNVMKMTRQ